MKAKINFLFLSSLFLSIFLISLTSAAINITSPVDGTNYTRTNILFNVSFTNVTDLDTPKNVTFFANPNGNATRIIVGNSSVAASPATCSANACWMLLNLSIADGNYTINATLTNLSGAVTGSIDVRGNANASMNVVFDGTPPAVQAENFSSPVVGGNYSGASLNLNVSIIDSTMGIQSVYFNITNGSGVQNATFTPTNSAGNQYNFTISTLWFPDGTYNITVYTNDSLNNLNNTAVIYSLVIDNTAPSASVSCTPSSVDRGNTVTCTCSASDATSGAQSPSYTANPSTALTGVITTTCGVSDYAGNSFTTSTTYLVNGAGGGGSSSGGGGGGSSTTPTATKVNTFTEVTASSPAVFSVTDGTIGVSEVQVNVNEKATNVKVTASKYSSKPSQVTAKDGKVYQYIEIKVENAAGKLADSKITTKVEKSWVSDNGFVKEDIALFRFNDGSWNELSTTFSSEDSTYYYYESTTPGFSFFALGSKVEEVQNSPPNTTTNTDSGDESSNLKIFGMILIAIAIIGAIVFFVKKSRK